jgi:hypothetical protein
MDQEHDIWYVVLLILPVIMVFIAADKIMCSMGTDQMGAITLDLLKVCVGLYGS